MSKNINLCIYLSRTLSLSFFEISSKIGDLCQIFIFSDILFLCYDGIGGLTRIKIYQKFCLCFFFLIVLLYIPIPDFFWCLTPYFDRNRGLTWIKNHKKVCFHLNNPFAKFNWNPFKNHRQYMLIFDFSGAFWTPLWCHEGADSCEKTPKLVFIFF